MRFPTFGRVIAHKKLDELNRAKGPAVYIAQPEGLGLWFSHRGEGQRPGRLVREAMTKIPCDLLTTGSLTLSGNSMFVSQPFSLV